MLKWFRKVPLSWTVLPLATVSLSAAAAMWQGAPLHFNFASGWARWIENVPADSNVEKALYRLMQLPGGDVLFRRTPKEAVPALTSLQEAQKANAFYSLRALEEEQALDFDAAERDWKAWADKAEDPVAAHLDLADFYDRRLKPQQEIAALEFVGVSTPDVRERWTAVPSQRAWLAWQRAFKVVDTFALPHAESARLHAAWVKRFPAEPAAYQAQLNFLLAEHEFAPAADVLVRYRAAFPQDAIFPVKAEADLAVRRGQAKDGLAVYDAKFAPLWPAELIKSYIGLVIQSRQERAFADGLRAKLAADPDNLRDAARLFYLYQQQGQLDSAKAVLAHFRESKEARGAAWKSEELDTLEQIYEGIQDFPEAARYAYALAADKSQPASEGRGTMALARILLTAPEQPLRVGAGNLALYKNIATMDRGPGYLNGILSLLLNTQGPAGEYASEDQLATPYFHRARAAGLLSDIDQRFPDEPARASLHAGLMTAYGAYGEDQSVIREGTYLLAKFPKYGERVQVALQLADAYERTRQVDQEFAVYQGLLQELAVQADGVPLGGGGDRYSQPVSVPEQAAPRAVEPKNADAESVSTDDGTPPPVPAKTAPTVRSQQYAQVLDRYLARLVALHRLPDALTLLRGELDRNPQDPGLYEKLAGFLEQNALNSHEEEVYQRAIEQFQDTGWYAKLGRFYLRQKRSADYSALMHKVADAFAGTEIESFLEQAPAPDRSLALQVDLYAYQHFPHDLRFVERLVAEYGRSSRTRPELEKLLWTHWSESAAFRNRLFELLSSTGRLDAQLAVLRQQSPEIEKGDWSGLAERNPAAGRFWLESCLWQSRYEEGLGAANALAQAYPADTVLGEQASSLYRSLAYFHPENTEKAVAIEKRLLDAQPANLDLMARIGDTYADQNRLGDAAPYWLRMAEVRPGEADGYLQSATVFWDYFDFSSAQEQLQKGRERLHQPALFAYQQGAIEESQGDLPGAVRSYTAGALAEPASVESHDRLLALARRSALREHIEAGTSALLKTASPTSSAIQLRAAILEAGHRKTDLAKELDQLVAQTSSFDVLDAVAKAARSHALADVEEAALRRQIALTNDPVRDLQLRYQLVDRLQEKSPESAAREIDAINQEHGKILGVVRATVDYDWEHQRRPQAVSVLIESAKAAYPDLKSRFELEAARKLTDLGDYPRARTVLTSLLSQKPLDAGYEAAMANNYARSGDQAGLTAFYHAQLDLVRGSSLAHDEKLQRIGELRRGIISASTLLGNANEAVDQYIELINAYPDDAALDQEAALYAVAHGARNRLFSFYQKTIADSPRDARWSIVLARLATAAEDISLAVDSYSKALRLRPERQDLYIAQASLEERLHRLDDAMVLYRKLYTLSYRDPQWMDKVAELYARQGQRAEAVKALSTGHIEGKPAKAANSFKVAAKLEGWGLLDEAQTFADQGVAQAGPDLLVSEQSGAATYARILTRQRQVPAAYARLVSARQKAPDIPLAAVASQVIKQGPAAVTSDEWRKQFAEQRRKQATLGFAQALKAMGAAAGEYDTPEEKTQLANFLKQNSASASSEDLGAVVLPAVKAARLAELTAQLEWKIAASAKPAENPELASWLQFEKQRVQADAAATQLEKFASTVSAKQQPGVWKQALDIYRSAGDTVGELRATERLAAIEPLQGEEQARYYRLLLAQHPQALVKLAAGEDTAAQYLVRHGTADQALSGIAARGAAYTPVWQSAYAGLAGLYLRENRPDVHTAFSTALNAEATIGDWVAHPVDRDRRLAGGVWFYYGSRYAEYLDLEKDPRAEDFADSELEHTPTDASAYLRLADYASSLKRDDPALADYQHSLNLHHDQPAVLDSIAVLQWNRGHKDEAATAWKEAVRLLAAEMDARPVPENFWGDFTRVLASISAHGQYDAVRQAVDAMLRIYIVRNEDYRVDPLLEAGYRANGDSVDWLLTVTASSHNQASVLESTLPGYDSAETSWIKKDQISRILARVVELKEREPQEEGSEFSGYSVDSARQRYVQALIEETKIPEAAAELAKVSDARQNSAEWLPLVLKVSEAEGKIDQLLAAWKKEPAKAPVDRDLRAGVAQLGDKASRAVRRFVYEQALNRRELTAPNFLGLAAIDLDDGDTPSAVALLKRLTLVSENYYADTSAAAHLLESHGKAAEAIEFLRPLMEASPWDSEYKVRLAKAQMAVNPQEANAVAMLNAVAGDLRARYADRIAAALALNGHSSSVTGSDELKLLAQPGCPTVENASKAFFVAARFAAAQCASQDQAKEKLLRDALAIDPDGEQIRLAYIWSAFALHFDSRGLLAAEPYLEFSYYGRNAGWGQSNDESNMDSTDTDLDTGMGTQPRLDPPQLARMEQLAAAAYERRHDTVNATRMLAAAIDSVSDKAQKTALGEQQKRIDLEQRRDAENDARMPSVHPAVEQDRIVRPRLLPGMPVPAETAEEEQE